MTLPLDPQTVRPADRSRPQHELSRCEGCDRWCWRRHDFLCDDCARSRAERLDRELSANWGSVW